MSNVEFAESLPEADRGGTPLCERFVVGSILIDGGMRAHTKDLSPSEFGDAALGKVFQMLMDVDGPVDLAIAVDEAEKRGLAKATGIHGMMVYLSSLMDYVPDLENIGEYAKRVKRAAVARRVASEFEKLRLQRANRMAL